MAQYNDLFGFQRFAQAQDQARQWERQAQQDAMAQQQNALAMDTNRARLADIERQNMQRNALSETMRSLAAPVQSGGPLRGGFEPLQFQQQPVTRERIFTALARQGMPEALAYAPKEQAQPGYKIIDGQYVPEYPGGRAIPVPGFNNKKQIERTVDLGDKVEYIYTNGERETRSKAATPSSIIMGNAKTPKMEMDMRKEFTSLPEVKGHVEISSQLQRLEKAMEENKRGGSKVAVDQALITILNKMLDPSSVVRESEYARTPGDLAFLNRMRGKIEKLKTGGAGLADEDRAAIADMARNFAAVSQSMYEEQANYYGGLAERYGYNPENVVRLGGVKKKPIGAVSEMSDDDLLRALGAK